MPTQIQVEFTESADLYRLSGPETRWNSDMGQGPSRKLEFESGNQGAKGVEERSPGRVTMVLAPSPW